jgi:site-specific DNA-methyltransferase (adenine-specific)
MIKSEYIESKMNSIIHADCLEAMKKIPDKYFDLVLTDPPYGIGISSNPIRQKHGKKNWDDFAPSEEHFQEIIRISKNQIIWGANYFDLPPSKCFLVWDKKQPYEFSLAMAELAYCSIDFPAKIYSHSNRGDEDKKHPSQKPLKLMEFCIEFARSREDIKTVFDPFMGSGTTAVACQSLGLEWCGCELEADYVAISNKRLEAVQGSLF